MVMEHSQEQSSESLHNVVHSHDLSTNQAKMEIMLLKIAIDAVDAYNHVCKDHQIEIISTSEGTSVYSEVDELVASQRSKSSSEYLEDENIIEESIADEEAIAALSEALSSEDDTHPIRDDTFDDSNEIDSDVTAEMISGMISGNETTESDYSEMPPQNQSFESASDVPSIETSDMDMGTEANEAEIELNNTINQTTINDSHDVIQASEVTENVEEVVASQSDVEPSIVDQELVTNLEEVALDSQEVSSDQIVSSQESEHANQVSQNNENI